MLGRHGRYRWFLSRATPIRDEQGRVTRWFGTGTDITEARFLDDATKLLNSSLDYAGTLEQVARLAVPDIADWCIVDLALPEGGIQRVAIEHIEPAKVDAARAWARKYPIDPNASQGVGLVIRTGQVDWLPRVSDEALVNYARDAEHLSMLRSVGLSSFIVAPLLARGRTLGAVSLLTADSGRRYTEKDVELARELGVRAGIAIDNARLYQESQRALAAREEAVRSRDEVLAIVSHDLRSPLSAINLGTASLLQLHGDQPGSRKRLEILQRSTNRMTHLINDLLDMAALQAKGLSLSITPEDPVQLATRVVEGLEPIAAERGIALVRDLAPIAGPLHCDRDRVEQVFENLIGNAIKYCRSGDSIFVRARSVGASVEYCIADTGPGIAVNEAARIFEPYWSAKRAEAKRGTGLGLYIAKGIVEAHGGSIGVISREGQGATFWFTIPLASK
jgi:signal transduction histidine kinase